MASQPAPTASSPTTTAPQPVGGNVAAVASGKGGVGKTWFAITLAHAIGRAGKKALLFAGHLGLANVDIQLGLMPDRDQIGRASCRERVFQFVELVVVGVYLKKKINTRKQSY